MCFALQCRFHMSPMCTSMAIHGAWHYGARIWLLSLVGVYGSNFVFQDSELITVDCSDMWWRSGMACVRWRWLCFPYGANGRRRHILLQGHTTNGCDSSPEPDRSEHLSGQAWGEAALSASGKAHELQPRARFITHGYLGECFLASVWYSEPFATKYIGVSLKSNACTNCEIYRKYQSAWYPINLGSSGL